jgi:hypothetical protein
LKTATSESEDSAASEDAYDMSSSMLIHDTRVEGTAPGGVPNVFKVNRSVPLDGALGWVAQYARENGGLDRLLILCHGFRGLVNDPFVGMSTTDLGFGLALCREGLTFKTVARTARLKGLIRHILIYACGAARTRPGFENTRADGFRLCRELAGFTDASVTAAVETQYYHMGPVGFFHRVLGVGPQDVIDLGPWEGRLFRFNPDGSVGPPCSR